MIAEKRKLFFSFLSTCAIVALICFVLDAIFPVVLHTIGLQARGMHADLARTHNSHVPVQLKALMNHNLLRDHAGRDVREMGSTWKLAQPVCAWLS